MLYHPEQQRNQKSLGNSGAIIQDLGDGILNLEFQSKMNTIEVMFWLLSIKRSIVRKIKVWLLKSSSKFLCWTNIGMIFMMAVSKEYDD
jgi:3-hydroxyacyl-CoA dehydrogenase